MAANEQHRRREEEHSAAQLLPNSNGTSPANGKTSDRPPGADLELGSFGGGGTQTALQRQLLKPFANTITAAGKHNATQQPPEAAHDTVSPSLTLFLAVFGAILGGLSMGLALGYTAPAFLDMERENERASLQNKTSVNVLDLDKSIREHQKGLIGSSMAIGALVAALANEPCNKIFGRRIPLLFSGGPFLLGWLLIAFAEQSIVMMVTGRVLLGACSGVACASAPTYVVEIAPPKSRGLLGTTFQLMVVVGNLVAAIAGMFLTWRQLALLFLSPAVLMTLIMFFMPESPAWLLNKSRRSQAKAALQRLRSGPIEAEFERMSANSTATSKSPSPGPENLPLEYNCDTFTSREFCRPLLLTLGLMLFQQFSGINAVLMYQGDIFKKAAPDSDALLSTVWVCLAQVIATLVCSSLIDKLGRKILLFASAIGLMGSLFVFGLYSHFSESNRAIQQDYALVPLISLILFMTFFSLGFGPIPWLMAPELASPRMRSLIASFGACFAWSGAYLVTATMKPLIELVGDAGTYWLFSALCATSCFLIAALPETKA